MTQYNNHINENLLASFLLGECTPEEQKQVIAWLDANKANRRQLDQLEKLWIETGKLNPRPIFVHKTKAWKRINQKIKAAEFQMKRVKRNFHYALVYSSIAASILVIFGIFSIYETEDTETSLSYNNPTDSIKPTELPDGTHIQLNELASLEYINPESRQERKVKLQGEAFFKVKRDTLRPFIIDAGIGGIRVLGTSFNVKIHENKDVEVSVKTGKVELYYPRPEQKDSIHLVLIANESAIISHIQQNIIPQEMKVSAFFWMDKNLSFGGQSLKEVFQILEECYQVNIQFEDEEIYENPYSSTFINKELEEILQVISNTFDLKYEKKENTYFITDSSEK